MGNPHKAKIIEMRKAGKWPTEIAKELGIGRNAVIGICYRAGLADPNVDRKEIGRLFNPGPVNPPRGEGHWNSKVSDEDVRAIRARYVKGKPGAGSPALAREFGVAQMTVWKIVTGQAWAHVQ